MRDDIRALSWVRWAFRLDKVSRLDRRLIAYAMYRSLADAIRDAEARGIPLSQRRARDGGRRTRVGRRGDPRRRSARARTSCGARSNAGSSATCDRRRGWSVAMRRSCATGPAGPLAGTPFRDILARALAVQEVNAAMGVIVAAPTAGGAGVLPAVLTGLAARADISDETLVDALATAGLIGAVVAERASLSGAEGGCQAETGAAAGMAAGAGNRNARRIAVAGRRTPSRSRSRERSASCAIRSADWWSCRAFSGTPPARRSRWRRSRWRWPGSRSPFPPTK